MQIWAIIGIYMFSWASGAFFSFAEAKTVPGKTLKTQAQYVANPYQCKSCHEPQYAFWNKTKHSSAYLVLYAKQQHFDSECVACHSVGFAEKAGFTHIADAMLLKGAPPRKSGEKPVVETVLEATFVGEKEGLALDSRQQPERYAKLKAAFHTKLDALQNQPGWEKIYAGVQCENCHGNRAMHLKNRPEKGKKLPVQKTACTTCHDSDRDPGFSFAAKREQVACPKIGPKIEAK